MNYLLALMAALKIDGDLDWSWSAVVFFVFALDLLAGVLKARSSNGLHP